LVSAMDLIRIIYHDITEYEEVEYTKKLSELKPDRVELIGWKLYEDEKLTILAIGKSDETYEHVYIIPNGCILKVDKISN
jgi:hypothetical protein